MRPPLALGARWPGPGCAGGARRDARQDLDPRARSAPGSERGAGGQLGGGRSAVGELAGGCGTRPGWPRRAAGCHLAARMAAFELGARRPRPRSGQEGHRSLLSWPWPRGRRRARTAERRCACGARAEPQRGGAWAPQAAVGGEAVQPRSARSALFGRGAEAVRILRRVVFPSGRAGGRGVRPPACYSAAATTVSLGGGGAIKLLHFEVR